MVLISLKKYLSDSCIIYKCNSCGYHLAKETGIISKLFQGQSGPAYLFSDVYNIKIDDLEQEKQMTTGKHRIKAIKCSGCKTVIGWKYLQAYNQDQRYKEGKCVIERYFITPFDNSTVQIPKYLQTSHDLITKINYYHMN